MSRPLVSLLLVALLGLGAPVAASAAPRISVSLLERELFARTNADRAAEGLAVLTRDVALVALARVRSRDMARRGYFSHDIPPRGERVFALLSRRGYCYTIAGENLGRLPRDLSDAAGVIERAFLRSPKHRANLLDRRWRALGIGVARAPDGRLYFTVLFSRPC